MRNALALLLLIATVAPAQEDRPGGRPKVEVKKFQHTPPCPQKCKTCSAAMTSALEYLSKQIAGGFVPAGNESEVVATSLAGLAFMANGSTPKNGPYAKQIEKAAQFVLGRVETRHPFSNWFLGFSALFLSEYYLSNPSPAVEQKLKVIVSRLSEQREANGGWGHSPKWDYGDFVAATNLVLAGLGALRVAKIPVPDEVVENAVRYLESCSRVPGRLGYSPRPNDIGMTGLAGRSAGAAYAMARCGVESDFQKKLADYAKGNLRTLPKDHSSPTMHYLFGGLLACMAGKESWNEYRDLYLDLWLSAQQADGSFICPTESDSKAMGKGDMDALAGVNYSTGAFAVVFALPLDKTNLVQTKAKGGRGSKGGGLGFGGKEPAGGWIGARVVTASDGVLVKSVVADAPAVKAGLAAADTIIEINGRPVKTVKAARDLLKQMKPGTKVTLMVLRGGQKTAIDVLLGGKPETGGGDEEI